MAAAGRLCDRDILFDCPRARADRSNDRAADQEQTAAEDHDLATIALLDAEERRAWIVGRSASKETAKSSGLRSSLEYQPPAII